MRRFLILFLFPIFLFSYRIEVYKWTKKDTFYAFLKSKGVPFSIYYKLSKNIRKKLNHIKIGEKIFILTHNNILTQALIPISDDKQLQILYKNNKYFTKIVPIVYKNVRYRNVVTINHYLNYDVYKTTGSLILSKKLVNIFKERINLRKLPYNTKLDIIYEKKFRFGEIKDIKILYAKFYNKYYSVSAFLNPYDHRYYDAKGISLNGMFLKAPLKYKRISSKFGWRYHPIYHTRKMHEGVDFVNRVGTPIHSIAEGKIIYKGWIRGYGKSIKIKHKNGYISLYAHMKGFNKKIRVGQYVKQGQVIGYLGNTGLSTGPHLHLGVMHNNRWVDPLKLKNVKVVLRGYKKRKFLAYISNFARENNVALK